VNDNDDDIEDAEHNSEADGKRMLNEEDDNVEENDEHAEDDNSNNENENIGEEMDDKYGERSENMVYDQDGPNNQERCQRSPRRPNDYNHAHTTLVS
jgi:hypothetical protein